MTVKKAIILLYPPSTEYIPEIKKFLTSNYQNNDWEIIKVISAADEYDSDSLQQLIEIARKQDEPISLIIDHNAYTSLPQYILLWSVFGTLVIAGLIDYVYVYRTTAQQPGPLNKIEILKKSNLDFLSLSSFYFQDVMTSTHPKLILTIQVEDL